MSARRQTMKEVHQTLAEAGRRKMAVFVKYGFDESRDAKSKTFLVEPYSYRGDRFFGYDRDAGSIKAFKLLQIHRVTISDQQFKPRWKVELAGAAIQDLLLQWSA